MTSEKRRFSRLSFNTKAKLTMDGTDYSVEEIVNLSVGGCLLEINGQFLLGSDCVFTIFLPHMAPGIEVRGEVVRVENGLVSLKFIEIEAENLFHLQNIIRYNAEDPDAIEKEISAHPGLR